MTQNLRGSGKNSRAAATLTIILNNLRAPFSEARQLTSWHRLVFYWHDHNLRQNPNTKSQTRATQQSANTTRCWTNWARGAALDLIQTRSFFFFYSTKHYPKNTFKCGLKSDKIFCIDAISEASHHVKCPEDPGGAGGGVCQGDGGGGSVSCARSPSSSLSWWWWRQTQGSTSRQI